MLFSFLFTTLWRVLTIIPITSRITKWRRFVIATISTSIIVITSAPQRFMYRDTKVRRPVLPQIVNNWFSETRFAQDKKILDLASGPYVSISSMFYFEMCRFGHSAHGSLKEEMTIQDAWARGGSTVCGRWGNPDHGANNSLLSKSESWY